MRGLQGHQQRGAGVSLIRHFSSYQAELHAILITTRAIYEEGERGTHIIVSDCTSAILAATHFNNKRHAKQLSSHSFILLENICTLWGSVVGSGSTVLFLAIKAHAGYRPNIYADAIATSMSLREGCDQVGGEDLADLCSK